MARPSTKFKERIKAFDDDYILLEHDGGYCLYDKRVSGKRSQHKYLGKFYISNGTNCRYAFRDDYYDSVDELVAAIEKYNETLPFDPDTYNPIFRKHVKVEYALDEYLAKLGFKHVWRHNGNDTLYRLSDPYGQTICDILYNVKEDTTEGSIRRPIIGYDSRWQEVPFTDMDTAIAAVNSIIAVYCGIVNAQLLNALNQLTHSRAALMLDKEFSFEKMDVIVEDSKQKTIAFLEEELRKLKETI